ncbi:type II secretion system protein E [Carboxydocella sp. JDF658]|nr:type II secretion system protein E [Carboxydocella sp. ULO1]GAW31844.1 type II secretion system protein E [Carboxydocella sp. JDF658]
MSLLKRLEKEKGSEGEKSREHSGFSGASAPKVTRDPYADLKVRIHKEVINELEEEISKGGKMEDLDEAKLAQQIEDVVQTFLDKEAAFIPRQDRQKIVQEIIDEVLGFGPINPLINDPTVSEIMVNGPNQVYVERKGKLELTDIKFRDNDHVLHIIEKIVAPIGRRIDESMPMVDARLPDGSRVNAIIPPLALKGPTITIRKFSKDPLKIEDLIRFGTLTVEMAKFLDACVKGKLNIVVSGGTGSGKCMLGRTPVLWSDGWNSIGKKVDEAMLKQPPYTDGDGWEYVDTNLKVLSFDWTKGEYKLAENVRLWRHRAPDQIYKIKTATGREIEVTPEHPFFTLVNGNITEIKASDLSTGLMIAVPSYLPIHPEKVNILDQLMESNGLYVKDDFADIKPILAHEELKKLARKLNKNYSTVREWFKENNIPIKFWWLIRKHFNKTEEINRVIVKAKTSNETINISLDKFNTDIFWLLGLLLADGHLGKKYLEIHGNNVDLLEQAQRIVKENFEVYGQLEFPRNRTPRIRFYSSALVEIFEGLGVPRGKKADKIKPLPWWYKLDNDSLSGFISGLWDGDGYIGKNALEYSSKSPELIEFIRQALLHYGIISIYRRKREHHYAIISGLDNIKRFYECFSLKNRKKLQHLTFLAQSPIVSNQKIGQIASYPVFWDKIIEVELIKNTEPYVYDITVSDLHNFIAGTGGGFITHNTTTLNVLSSFIPNDERIITIEDAAELQLRQEHVVTLETRPPNIEGKGAITMRDLVRNSLRMRPDRIVVGEVRSGEALDMLQAMNTGHDGSLTTGHANSPRDMLARLETMVLMAGMELPVRAIREQIASAIDVIVQQSRLRDGSRKITHITEVVGMEGDTIVLQDIFVYEQMGVDDKGKIIGRHRATGIRPKFMSKLEAAGIHLPEDIFINR